MEWLKIWKEKFFTKQGVASAAPRAKNGIPYPAVTAFACSHAVPGFQQRSVHREMLVARQMLELRHQHGVVKKK